MSDEHVLRNSASTLLLNNPPPMQRKAHRRAAALRSTNDLNGLARKDAASPLLTPTHSRFEFARPKLHVLNLLLLSGSGQVNVPTSVEQNAKYLSVIDLYGDDTPIPSPAPRPGATPRQSLRVDPGKGNAKEQVYSPASMGLFNFVSNEFDSTEDLDRETSRKGHAKQNTIYYSPQNLLAEDVHTKKKSDFNGLTSPVPDATLFFDSDTKPKARPEPPAPQASPRDEPLELPKQNLQGASKFTPISYATTPVSYATTPLLGPPAVSAHVTQSLVLTAKRKPLHNNMHGLIANNELLLLLQTLALLGVMALSESSNLLAGDRDRYGFKKKTYFVEKEEFNQWWILYEPYLIRRKKKWVQLMQQNGLALNKDSPTRFPPRLNKLKRYVRKGIPAEWRGNAWWYFVRGDEKLNANVGLYDRIVANTSGIRTRDAEIIERDLNRTFPDNIHFKGPEGIVGETPLIQSLRRVLVAFAIYQPQIGYCQLLNFLAGLLLLFLDEERAFWMLVIVTLRLLPGVHDVNLEGVNIDQGVLMLCVKEYLPSVWEKIGFNFESLSLDGKQNFNSEVNVVTKLPPITLCTASWFMSAFIGTLPIETCLRVWDCFFYEESKVFFRMALSILKLAEPKIERVRDEMEVFQIIQNFPKRLLDPKVLFECCFRKRGGFHNLSQDEIDRCRAFVKEQRKKASNLPEENLPNIGVLALDDEFVPEEYDFRKNALAGVHWKANLAKKLRKRDRRTR